MFKALFAFPLFAFAALAGAQAPQAAQAAKPRLAIMPAGGCRRSGQPADPATVERRNGRHPASPDAAPLHVQRVQALVRQGFYDGLIFHRVMPDFMAQGGDPTGTGEGGSPLPDLKAEFNSLPHLRGTVAAARAEEEDSANSQFYIMFVPNARSTANIRSMGGSLPAWTRSTGSLRASRRPSRPGSSRRRWGDSAGPLRGRHARRPVRFRSSARADRAASGAAARQRAAAGGRRRGHCRPLGARPARPAAAAATCWCSTTPR